MEFFSFDNASLLEKCKRLPSLTDLDVNICVLTMTEKNYQLFLFTNGYWIAPVTMNRIKKCVQPEI